MALALTTAAQRILAADAAILAAVGSDVTWPAYVFEHRLRVVGSLEGTGMAAVVVRQATSWAPANTYNTERFPTLVVDCYADVSRDGAGDPVATDAEQKLADLGAAVDALLHRPADSGFYWSTLRVITSVRSGETGPMMVPSGDYLVTGSWTYAIGL